MGEIHAAFAVGIGPRQVGGRYYDGYDMQEYVVLAINTEGGRWFITVQTDDEQAHRYHRTHSTPWDPKRDRVIHQPTGA